MVGAPGKETTEHAYRKLCTCLTHLFELLFEAPVGLLLVIRSRRVVLQVIAGVPRLAAVPRAALRRFAGMRARRRCHLIADQASAHIARLRMIVLRLMLRGQERGRRRERERQIEPAAAHRGLQCFQPALVT